MHRRTTSLALALAGVLVAAAPAGANIYTVTTDNGGGTNSLRWAIGEANDHDGHDTIVFQIEPLASTYTIAPSTELPQITDSVEIDGTTQPGYAGTPVIGIDASQLGNGLDLVAGDSTIRGLAIGAAGAAVGAVAPNGNAILVEGNRNAILDNHLGVNFTGTVGVGNTNAGVRVEGNDTIIGLPGAGNVIGANGDDGVQVRADTTGTVLEGNRIGVGHTGLPLGNVDAGIDIRAGGTRVGGSGAPAANVISGNGVGVRIANGTGSRVTGNLIGTDAAGLASVANGVGVEVRSAANVVGGTEPGEGNVIAGNLLQGALVLGAQNSVLGNTVGRVGLPNHTGVVVRGDDNTIGAGNTIAGNALDGVRIEDGARGDRVEAAVIESNGRDGVALLDAGDAIVADAHIRANTRHGVSIEGSDSTGPFGSSADHRITANRIEANGGSGVWIVDSRGNDVGDGNVISANSADGVTVESGTGNSILDNTIVGVFDDDDRPIDLGADGVTLNDALDADTGANQLQNHPRLGPLKDGALPWALDAAALRSYRLELLVSEACDGGSAVRTVDVTTDEYGHAAGVFAGIAPHPKLPQHYTVTATALTTVGVLPQPSDTSELSPCRLVPPVKS
jgi:hypothetical protein